MLFFSFNQIKQMFVYVNRCICATGFANCNSILLVPLLWRSGYLHDRGAEEVLQCHEETRVKKATKTNTQASGNYMTF